jgi:hypothetical protein
MHPLTPDLTNIPDDELHKKIGELYNRLVFAGRTGNPDLAQQVQLVLDDYNTEVQRRNQKILDDSAKNGKDLTDKIDITR